MKLSLWIKFERLLHNYSIWWTHHGGHQKNGIAAEIQKATN